MKNPKVSKADFLGRRYRWLRKKKTVFCLHKTNKRLDQQALALRKERKRLPKSSNNNFNRIKRTILSERIWKSLYRTLSIYKKCLDEWILYYYLTQEPLKPLFGGFCLSRTSEWCWLLKNNPFSNARSTICFWWSDTESLAV